MNHFQRCLGGAALLVLGACSSPTTGWSTSNSGTTTTPVTPSTPPTVKAVAAGLTTQAFLLSDGSLWTQGGNANGQLGVGDTDPRSKPTYVTSPVSFVSAGSMFNVFLDNSHQLWGNGYSYLGALGPSHHSAADTVPFSWASDVQGAAAGSDFTLYVDTSGQLYGTGGNHFGQLMGGSTNDTGDHENPRATLTDVVAVAAGTASGFVIKKDHTLWAAGLNTNGQLGTGDQSIAYNPVQVATGVASVAPGNTTVLYLANDADSTLYGCGDNSHHQLVAANTDNQLSWVALDTHVISMAAGNAFVVWVKDDHSLWGQGSYTNSVLGPVAGDHDTPVQLATGIQQVAARSSFWIAVTVDGRALGAGESFGWPPVELAFQR